MRNRDLAPSPLLPTADAWPLLQGLLHLQPRAQVASAKPLTMMDAWPLLLLHRQRPAASNVQSDKNWLNTHRDFIALQSNMWQSRYPYILYNKHMPLNTQQTTRSSRSKPPSFHSVANIWHTHTHTHLQQRNSLFLLTSGATYSSVAGANGTGCRILGNTRRAAHSL